MTTVEKLLVANLVGEVAIVGVVIRSHNKQLDASVDLKKELELFLQVGWGLE